MKSVSHTCVSEALINDSHSPLLIPFEFCSNIADKIAEGNTFSPWFIRSIIKYPNLVTISFSFAVIKNSVLLESQQGIK